MKIGTKEILLDDEGIRLSDFEAALSNSDIRRVQRSLDVADDGLIGPRTRSAIAAFQEKNGLSMTGFIDPDLLKMLVSSTTTTLEGAQSSYERRLEPPELRILQQRLGVDATGSLDAATRAAIRAKRLELGLEPEPAVLDRDVILSLF